MASISITIPDAMIPALVPVLDAKLLALGIDITGMSNGVKAKRYIAEVIKDVYINTQRNSAQTTAQTAVNSAVATATTDAAGIS